MEIVFEMLGNPSSNAPLGPANLVSPQYFAALHIPLLKGRIWSDVENSKGAHVAVINHTLAQRYFPNGDALGHSLKLPGIEGNPATVCPAEYRNSYCRLWASSRMRVQPAKCRHAGGVRALHF
jgi:hypothetical protein